MAHQTSDFVCLPQSQVMHRVFIESFDAQWAAQRDHPRARLDVGQTTTLIDAFAAYDAQMIPVCYVRIF